MWAALLGAIVGGALAISASLYLELRRDRRRQIGNARLAVDEWRRAGVELAVLAQEARDRNEPSVDGPIPQIGANAWFDHVGDFVTALCEEEFSSIESTAADLRIAGEYGFRVDEVGELQPRLYAAMDSLHRVGRIRRIDRLVWRI